MMKAFVVFFLLALSGAALAASTEDLRAFAGWLGENGVETKVNLGVFEDSRFGAVAAQDIEAGDAILKIPKKLMITQEVIKQSGYAPLLEFKEYANVNDIYVLWYLKEKQNPASFWQPYFKILPSLEDFKDHPVMWADSDFEVLQSSPGKANMMGQKKRVDLTYDYLKEKVVDANPGFLSSFTKEEYIHAYLCASTRQWGMAQQGNAWVPLADMLNHKAGAGTGSLNLEGTHFVINATEAYKSGDQVYDSYGAKSNEDCLRTYGFVPDENVFDFVKVSVSSTAVNLVQSIITPVIEKIDANWREVYMQTNKRSDTLLRAFRLNQMEFKELEYLNDAVAGKAVSLLNELRAYRSAISVLSQLLQSYGTSESDDEKALEDESLSNRARMAIKLRKSEKAIIRNQILVIGKLWENILIEGTLPGGVPIR